MVNKKVFWILVIFVFVLLSSFIVGASFYDGVYGMTSVRGKSVSGNSYDEILKVLKENFSVEKDIVKVEVDGKIIDFNAALLGIEYDYEQTARNVYDTGRKGDFLKRFTDVTRHMFMKNEVPLKLKIKDEQAVRDNIHDILIDNNVLYDSFIIEEDDKMVKITVNQNSTVPNTIKMQKDIIHAFEYGADNLKAEYLVAKKADLETIFAKIHKESENAKIEKDVAVPKVIPHKNGVTVDKKLLAKGLMENKLEIILPKIILEPLVKTSDIEGDFFKDVLSTYTTYYKEGQIGRSKNVSLSSAKLNGVVLNPGEVFSFNGTVGRRTRENGYQIANVYMGGKIVEDIGGGICQSSSTLYNAVLYGDFEVVERRNHMFFVSYVKPGTDATVSYGTIDFKFKNNKGYPIKIKTKSGKGALNITVLGTKEKDFSVVIDTKTLSTTPFNEQVEETPMLSGGETKVKQNGQNGMKVETYKTVKDLSGNVIFKQNLGISTYVPLSKIIQKGVKAPVVEVIPDGIPKDTVIIPLTESTVSPSPPIIVSPQPPVTASPQPPVTASPQPQSPTPSSVPDTATQMPKPEIPKTENEIQ